MQLRERAPVGVSMLAAAIATIGLVAASYATRAKDLVVVYIAATEIDNSRPDHPVIVDTSSIMLDEALPVLPAADAAYRRRAFGEAARIARTISEGDSRLGATAEPYWQ